MINFYVNYNIKYIITTVMQHISTQINSIVSHWPNNCEQEHSDIRAFCVYDFLATDDDLKFTSLNVSKHQPCCFNIDIQACIIMDAPL